LRDRDLVRLYWPVELRPAFDALFAIDDAMADVVAQSTQPALAAIKLAWWRERLEELDQGKVPAEPRLQATAAELLPRGISGADLAGLEESWALILQVDEQSVFMKGVVRRGPTLFKLAARLLGVDAGGLVIDAAHSFSSVDLAKRNITSLGGGQKIGRSKDRAPRRARPLTALGALARRDMRSGGPPFEREASPARAWALLRHRLTGRY
jgi:phytoene synthase